MVPLKGKELKALITLAGKVDPSLQKAMLKASKQTQQTAGFFGKAWNKASQGVSNLQSKVQKLPNGLKVVGATGKEIFGAAGKVASGFGKAIKGIGLAAGVTAGIAIAAFAPLASQGLQYASDLNEVQNVVDTTFRENADTINIFADAALEAYGLTTLQAKQYSSVIGSMTKSMGVSADQTLVMSQNMTALAGDMASFYNLEADEAFEKIRAGISGETEPLKQLGINMSVANLQAYALSQGMGKAYDKMTQAEQATLRYNYLLSTTADAQGDFSKTSGSFANQQKLMKANIQQMSGEIMTAMLPALASGMQQINGFIKSLDTQSMGAFVGQLAEMALAFLPLVMDLMPLFGDLINMLLPPLMNIARQLMPIITQAVQVLLTVLEPLLPPLIAFVENLLPPIQTVLTAIAPLLSTVAQIIGSVLGPALKMVTDLITGLADLIARIANPVGDFFKKVGGFLGIGGKVQSEVAAVGSSTAGIKLPAYAQGGFTSSPAIFGDDGLEAAIPIRPGNPRSLSLLARTAKLLGVAGRYPKNQPEQEKVEPERGPAWPGKLWPRQSEPPKSEPRQLVHFTYSPVFQTREQPTESVLKRDARNIRRVLDDYFGNKRRLAWE